MTTTNEQRRGWARDALHAYRGGHDHDAIADLICDLLHLAKRMNLDPLERAAVGISNYACEAADEPDGMAFHAKVAIHVGIQPYGDGRNPVFAPWGFYET